MAPVLIEKNEELRKALEVINGEKKVANEKERVVSAEGEIACALPIYTFRDL